MYVCMWMYLYVWVCYVCRYLLDEECCHLSLSCGHGIQVVRRLRQA
jgi:hypothetical protein